MTKIRDQAHYDSLQEAGVTPLHTPTSFKPEVIADNSDKWCGNSIRFATQAEAVQYLGDLALRWTAVRNTRVVESNDPVTCRYADGQTVWLNR